jgi:signal transduction histidine kinase
MQVTDAASNGLAPPATAARPPAPPPLLALVAHDLRQPTSAALMAAEFADELVTACGSAAVVRRQLALIQRCMRESLRLQQDLLVLGQAGAGALRLRHAPLDFADLLHDAAAIATPQARAKRVDVHVQPVGPGIDGSADRQRLLQVLLNLCDNAVKFTPPGGTVRIGVTSDGEVARVTVTDSGPGVPASSLARVFDQYWRAEPGSAGGGVGLGLSIAKWLVELHGGSIEAVNAPGGGLSVAFTIPLAERPDSRCAAPDGADL